MKFFYILIAACTVYPTLHLHAQTVSRTYATQSYQHTLLLADSTLAERHSAIERFTADYRSTGPLDDTVTIALVFHIVCPMGYPATPTASDIEKQLARLNEDFFSPPPPTDAVASYDAEGFAELAAPPLVRFCMPTQTPLGDTSDGVVIVASTQTDWAMSSPLKRTENGGSTSWNPQRYLNVWVAPLPDSLGAGYAQMPGGPDSTDGIVIDPRFFARAGMPDTLYKPFAAGRTLAHLVGSYLNLYELWNDEQPCADDYVDDTPRHNAPNHGEPEYRHVSLCPELAEGYAEEMTMNLMDNTDDHRQFMLTRGQVRRLHATLAPGGPRGELRMTPTGCTDTLEVDDRALPVFPPNSASRSLEFTLTLFPNPSAENTHALIYTTTSGPLKIQVFNTLGQLVWRQQVTVLSGSTTLTIPSLLWKPGTYFVRVFSETDWSAGIFEKHAP